LWPVARSNPGISCWTAAWMPPGATSVISSARAVDVANSVASAASTTVDDNRCLMAGHSSAGERPPRYRVFVAITLPEAVRHAIETAQTELRADLRSKTIRWTRREQFHMTLRFLGGVDVQQIDRLRESVRTACSGFGDLQLTASGIGVFPGVRRPRVVWAGIDDRAGRLALLQREIETSTSAFTAEPPEDRFTGHVTLARCRDITRSEAATLAGLVGRMATRSFGAWTVSDVEVIRSETLPTGSRYTTLEQAPL
jgi:2'-5' RNA ligase